MVAVDDDAVVGHVVATRARVDARPALGLGPLSVLPHRQRAAHGWADSFQVRTLTAYQGMTGRFHYAAPFDRL